MDDLPPLLIKQIADGKVALVLGAGASVGAIHPEGKRPPTGRELAQLLATEFLAGKYADSSLSMVAELAESESDQQTVQEFIAELFKPFTPAPFHKLIPQFRWHGIATVNYDLVIERAYADSKLHRLQPIISNADRMEDHLRSPNDLLLLKLHGCITKINDSRIPLILTPEQYITHRKGRSRLFEVFGGWARERTLVFVGTTLSDSDLRSILLEVAEDETSRAHVFISLHAKSMSRFGDSGREKKITMIAGTFEEFLTQIDSKITGIAAVPAPKLALPIYLKFTAAEPTFTESTQLVLENDIEFVHSALTSPVVDPKQFYRGFSQGMSAVQQNLDCPRDLTDTVLVDVILHDEPKRRADLVLVRASAGAGKTVFLHRLAWQAATDLNAFVVLAKKGTGLTPEALAEIGDLIDERLFLLIDDAADHAPGIERLLETATRRSIPLTIIVAERSNEWNVSCDNLVPYLVRPYDLTYLSGREIERLLDLLKIHNALGTLSSQPREVQESAFKQAAGGQLLVALHEATLGKPFEDIVKDEYEAIRPETAQSIYLTICTLNRTGTPVRAGLISRVHGIGFERFKEEFFRPLEHVVYAEQGSRGYDMEYRARHPHVAESVFRQVLPTGESRYDRLARIVSSLNVAYQSDRSSFNKIINHRTLMELLPDHSMIEQMFSLAQERAPDDGHVFLHHGLYEMRRNSGNLRRAEELLRKADGIMPRNVVVSHSFAELELTLAESAGNQLVRESHLKTAREIIAPMLGANARTGYGYHTAFKIEHMRLKDLLHACGDPEVITTVIRNAESVLSDGLQQYPDDSHLRAAEAELATTLGESDAAKLALEKSVRSNLRNAAIVARLAQMYRHGGDNAKAKELLVRALEVVAFDKRLNFLYAQVLMDDSGDGVLIEKHLRRSFTEGDKNLAAQFWYARQLYINGKIPEAQARFEKFNDQRMPPDARYRPRGEITEGGVPKAYYGRLFRVEQYYGRIERDVTGDHIHVRRDENDDPLAGRSRGDRLRFSIAFNFRGPIALMVEHENA